MRNITLLLTILLSTSLISTACAEFGYDKIQGHIAASHQDTFINVADRKLLLDRGVMIEQDL
jgi:hypothetical protein